MTNLTTLTLTEARKGLAKKDFSAVDLTSAFLKRMEDKRSLNAYITETPEQALEQAKLSDQRLSEGQGGALEGLPLGIKDLFCTKGIRTTSGSKMLENFVPPYESTVSANLLNAGGVFLGKTNMDEFAMGSANITSYFGPSISPWQPSKDPEKKLVPGGSSGGSAAAVAARLAMAATASDTGGSIRQPAAFCGLVGIKPTYGLCSRWGMIAFASSLDQAGPLTHTVADAALMLQVMAGHDKKDATSLSVEIPAYLDNLNGNIKGLKVGIVKEYIENLNAETLELLERGIAWLTEAGAVMYDISLKTTPYALPTYYVLAPAEASSNLARFDGVRYGARVDGKTLDDLYEKTRRACFGEEVRRRVLMGTYVLSAGYFDAYYLKAQKVRQLIAADFDQAFQKVDVLLTPTTPSAAFGVDERPTDPITMYLNDIYTVTVNMAGLPAISVPAGVNDEGLPLGLQLIGPALSEQLLLNVATVIEQGANFRQHRLLND
ncbi:Asp-tRNA(Asn)/Glu-tRNA(Gln) amidotransferase subunit GatA [Candidatus Finniella inopinata]|uniref:Glutamyl-tRNA(Gln) amidotransferase subunit A n=1 Tax=Candidatus Finniella inopinata TaxID=1696036 RepID=A0A4Q7DH84_9PROT|nr:Asp-tRNA(Asn)/Glu-tRNA(Gln) amidotransferase subunit GatA [Candidatus Finniella inopinata]RZI45395.1 Asp-tRNA(Asn)/Glu-tRNA(Gln) amidotransferase subunit GatA [Candidatus Finniella inopinata]